MIYRKADIIGYPSDHFKVNIRGAMQILEGKLLLVEPVKDRLYICDKDANFQIAENETDKPQTPPRKSARLGKL